MKEFLYENLITHSGTLTVPGILLNFLAACAVSLLIYLSYRTSHSEPVYSGRFNVSLVMITLITTLVMSVIGNNIALSLGMVGALSIVRFRTAIKDPRDAAYIFWGIAVGVCCGVSDYLLAGIGSVIIFFFLVLFGHIHDNERIMLILHMHPQGMEEMEKQMSLLFSQKAMLRVKNTFGTEAATESIYEISEKLLQEAEKQYGSVVNKLAALEGMHSVSLVRQDSDISQ